MFNALELFGWRPDEFLGMDEIWQFYALAYARAVTRERQHGNAE